MQPEHLDRSDNPESILNQGLSYLSWENYAAAVNCLKAVLQVHPDDPKIWELYGRALEKLGCYSEAIKANEKAVSNYQSKSSSIVHTPSLAWTPKEFYKHALRQFESGLYEETVASCDAALQIKPDNHSAWGNRGLAMDSLGRDEEAIASYDAGLKLQPDYLQAWYNRGLAMRYSDRNEEAIASYDMVLKLQPGYQPAWINRGNELDELDCHEEAIASFDAGLKLKPDSYEAWHNRGIAARNLSHSSPIVKQQFVNHFLGTLSQAPQHLL